VPKRRIAAEAVFKLESGLMILGTDLPLTGVSSQWGILIAAIVVAGTVLAAISRVASAVRMVVAPIREFMSEHDVLWEDYNIRTGGGYRRTTGRGTPPDPEEFYRKHPVDSD
jgi:hypothetical protein